MNDVILKGDVYACLEHLEDNSISVAITSPPYWKQRDYGFSGQIGQEETSEEYIGRLLKIYRKLREKLKENGIFFLNIGDKYSSRYGNSHLLLIPYKLAYHMVQEGWILEDIIIWFKTNHMPSSVRDRFANTFEPVLVLAKSNQNIFKKGVKTVLKLPLQQTEWKHTAVYPEKLIEELFNRVELHDTDLILDPFAGTGTTGVVVKKMRSALLAKRIYSILIEKGEEFVDIIQKRAGIKSLIEVKEIDYEWKPVIDKKLPDVNSNEMNTNKYGEICIAKDSSEFLSALKGITGEKFRGFHRPDSLFFFGVKRWDIADFYNVSLIFHEGYVLRNLIIIANGQNWYPLFMISSNNTLYQYRFYLDRIRTEPRPEKDREWTTDEFIGMKVADISGKISRVGKVINISKQYEDDFPKIALIQWNDSLSYEVVMHPKNDELVREGLAFYCPICNGDLEEPYDVLGTNKCPQCGNSLWTSFETIPPMKEPRQIVDAIQELENGDYIVGEDIKPTQIKQKKNTSSKFAELDRINWGASPGARKTIIGEYLSKMRLYRLAQPLIAKYLNLLRKSHGLSVTEITKKFPDNYLHTVGHWFRKDMGGSIPIPEDVVALRKIFQTNDGLLKILERTALKFQTVKASIKGRNPGDFLEFTSDQDVETFFRKLFISPKDYLKLYG